METNITKPVPSNEEVLAGVRRAVQKVIEQAKRDDEELVIADEEGNPVLVKARNL